MSMEQESGSSVLMEIHGMPGMGSMGRPPATVEMCEQRSNPMGEEADMLKTTSYLLHLPPGSIS